MKKYLALLMAALLAFGMVAVAEEAAAADPNALVAGMGNIVLTMTDAEGNASEIALSDLSVSFGIDLAGNPQIWLEADVGEEPVSYAVIELAGDKLHMAFKNVDRTFETELPEQLAGQDPAVLSETLKAALPQMMGITMLPVLPPVTLPMADLNGIAATFGGETAEVEGVTTTVFEVPAEAITQIAQMVVQIAKAGASSVPQVAQGIEFIESLLDSGFSFALKGAVTSGETEQAAVIGVYMADENGTAENPTLYLNIYSAENNFTLAVDLPSEDSSYTVGQLALVTDPAADTISLNLDIAGMFTAALEFYKNEGLQVAALNCSGMGMNAGLVFSYGQQDGKDYVGFSGSADGVGAFVSDATGVWEGDTYTGEFSLGFGKEGAEQFAVTGDYFEYMTVSEDDFEMPADVAPVSEITKEESNAIIQPLVDYFTNLFGAAEAA